MSVDYGSMIVKGTTGRTLREHNHGRDLYELYGAIYFGDSNVSGKATINNKETIDRNINYFNDAIDKNSDVIDVDVLASTIRKSPSYSKIIESYYFLIDSNRRNMDSKYGAVECPECGSRHVESQIKQLRSADESGTIIFKCLNCGLDRRHAE